MSTFKHAKAVAVFDVDETLIPFKSMFAFLEFAMKETTGAEHGARSFAAFLNEINERKQVQSRNEVNRLFYKVFKGWPTQMLDELAKQWWAQIPLQNRWITEAVDALKAHQDRGDPIILLSGSADFILRPIAADLCPDLVLAITLGHTEVGTCDGEIKGIQTIGAGKKDALIQAECLTEIDAYFVGYGDHESDSDFLNYCDEAYVVVPHIAKAPAWAEGFALLHMNGKARSNVAELVH